MQQKFKILKGRKMKVKSLGVALFLTFICSLSTLSAQTLYVKESNGTQTAYALNSIRNMSFSSGNLTVAKTDNSGENYALKNLRYLNFTNSTDVNEEKLIQESLIAYPNPVNNVLNIDLSGIDHQNGTLSIFNIEGKAFINRQVMSKDVISLDVSSLPKGIYLCRYSNSAEIKIVKIIKQ